mgnify:CR=1 FL=1
MFYIYILYSENSDKYYVGYTNDPERRLIEHNTKAFTTYTSKHRPWRMEFFFPLSENKSDAMRVEKYIKKQKSATFIRKIIQSKDDKEFMAQLVRVPFERD